MTLLKLSALEANYGAVRALQGISMDVGEGAVVALLGANGAGKSTTLKAISGMVQPSAGGIEFAGESLVGKTPNQILGCPDDLKLKSCMTLFERAKPLSVFSEVLETHYSGERCLSTQSILEELTH